MREHEPKHVVVGQEGLRTGPRLEPPLETLEAIAALLSSRA